MQHQRIGELLGRVIPLSAHDVDEILQEQRGNTRRFGEVAISLGLCRPEHVWNAWSRQQSGEMEFVNLDVVGIDSQAIALFPRRLAMRFGVIPVRMTSEYLIVATSDLCFEEASVGLPALVELKLKFVLAAEQQIQRAIAAYYPLQS